jgi:manganese/iron transport system permease protein
MLPTCGEREKAMIQWLIQPFQFAFMQRGIIASIVVGMLCAIIGCYVILRSMAFLGDALAHAILPGVAIAYLLGINLLWGALAAAILVAVLINSFTKTERVKEDTAIGILFAAALALGIALISTIRTYAVDLSHILFGNVLSVSWQDLFFILGLSFAILIILILAYRPLKVITFDPILAKTLNLPVEGFRLLLLILLAVTIVVSLQTVGIGLVAAMLVTPPAAAALLTRRLSAMIGVSAAIGAFSSLVGLYISFYLNVASGAAIVLVATLIFLLAFFFAPRRGMVWGKLSKNNAE